MPSTNPARLHQSTGLRKRAITARYIAPSAPMAADSVAVQMPNRITASTTAVSTPRGTTEMHSSLRISSCSPSMREKYTSSSAPKTAASDQNHA